MEKRCGGEVAAAMDEAGGWGEMACQGMMTSDHAHCKTALAFTVSPMLVQLNCEQTLLVCCEMFTSHTMVPCRTHCCKEHFLLALDLLIDIALRLSPSRYTRYGLVYSLMSSESRQSFRFPGDSWLLRHCYVSSSYTRTTGDERHNEIDGACMYDLCMSTRLRLSQAALKHEYICFSSLI